MKTSVGESKKARPKKSEAILSPDEEQIKKLKVGIVSKADRLVVSDDVF